MAEENEMGNVVGPVPGQPVTKTRCQFTLFC